MSQKFLLFCSFNQSTTVNIILWGIQKYMVSWIWSIGCTHCFLQVYMTLSGAGLGRYFYICVFHGPGFQPEFQRSLGALGPVM